MTEFKGNREHLEVLKKALTEKNIEIWNDFNIKLLNQQTWGNLKGANLEGVTLDGENLEGIMLAGANLIGASLFRAILKGADLKEANLIRANLYRVDLYRAELMLTKLGGINLQEAYLREANLKGADLREANLKGANLTYASLEMADLTNAILIAANFTKARLKRTILYKTDLRETIFKDAKCYQIIYTKKLLKKDKQKNGSSNISKNQKILKHYDLICDGIRTTGMYGDPIFKRYLEDQDYIESYNREHKVLSRLWGWTSNYGRSFIRWAAISVFTILTFSIIFYYCNGKCLQFEQTPNAYKGKELCYQSALYFSVVTFTTLGFGDIVAGNDLTRVLVWVEVIIGYIMLGGLIAIFATKVARRS